MVDQINSATANAIYPTSDRGGPVSRQSAATDFYVLGSGGDGPPKSRTIKFGVTRFNASTIDAGIVQNVESLITDGMSRYPQFNVISFKEIQDMLAFEMKKQLAGCETNVSCLAEIGGSLGVDKLVTGNVGFLGDTYIISLQLVDIRTAQVESRVQARVKKGNEQQLVEATDLLAHQLVAHLLPNQGVRVLRVLKWSDAVLTLAGIGLGIGMTLQSKGKEEEYNRLFSSLIAQGAVVQGSNGTQFKDEQSRAQYKDRLDGLKNESMGDASVANIAFVTSGILLATTGLFFYLDHQKSSAPGNNAIADVDDSGPRLRTVFSQSGIFAALEFSF